MSDDRRPSTGSRVNVLLAEDEESFVDALAIGLSPRGIRRRASPATATRRSRCSTGIQPDLVLLDIMLPKLSGIDVCRAIRARSSVPIIMVTAKGTEIDTVVGLEMGADDYVTKPYRLRELVARMHAVLRRAPRPGPRAPTTSTYRGRLRRPRRRRRPGRPRPPPGLRPRPGGPAAAQGVRAAALLIENPGRVLTRDTLIDRVWGTDYVGDTKTLDVHIKRLRTHVERDPSAPTIITTVRGVGYRFEVPADSLSAP